MQTLRYSCIALVAATMFLPYVLGVPPRNERERRYAAIAIGFLIWLPAGFVFLLSL